MRLELFLIMLNQDAASRSHEALSVALPAFSAIR
jgi:hypothetical protein